MKERQFRHISFTCKDPSRSHLRKLVILLLRCHVFLRKFRLKFAEPSRQEVAFYQFAEHLVLNDEFHLLAVVAIDEARHG
jgi:hypothetical protein